MERAVCTSGKETSALKGAAAVQESFQGKSCNFQQDHA